MEVSTRVHWENNGYWAELGSRMAARQTNISHTISAEDETPGFAIFDFRWGVSVGSGIVLIGGVDNIFDKYYWDFSSVKNLPSVGRNLHVSAVVGF
mgnify:FL=1